MSQIEKGIRSILKVPIVYDSFQYLMGANNNRTDFIQNFLKPESSANILDIGCGTADILAFLPAGINYYGYDQSETYIQHARSRFGGRGHFVCAKVDSMSIVNLPKMNIVLAGGLLHHLNDDEVINLLHTAKQVLKPDGKFFAIDPCYVDSQNIFAKWLIDRDRGRNVRSPEAYTILANKVFGQTKGDIVHRKWMPYTHHILTCES